MLMTMLLVGFVLARTRKLKEETAGALSKLEMYVFIPAMAFSAFSKAFTPESLTSVGSYLIASVCMMGGEILLAYAVRGRFADDPYNKNLIAYGLIVPNYGYMGTAVISGLYPAMLADYMKLRIIPDTAYYVWEMPFLLTPKGGTKGDWKHTLKSVFNPGMILMLLGMGVGISGLKLPAFLTEAADTLTNCMSPAAMLLTGITFGYMDLKKSLFRPKYFVLTGLRLLAIPILGILACRLFRLNWTLSVCIVNFLAMPFGLNSIVIPKSFGQDTTDPAALALISHVLACVTIPVIYMLLTAVCA